MRRDRSLRFDFDRLESRKLLTATHAARAARAATVAAPLVLNGTLAIDNKVATTTTDMYGDQITTTPVAGNLGSVGEVRGTWKETVDNFGQIEGVDTLKLSNAKGTFIVAFNVQNPGHAHKSAHGVYYEVEQKVADDTGAYAGASEVGTIEPTARSTKVAFTQLVLHTRGT